MCYHQRVSRFYVKNRNLHLDFDTKKFEHITYLVQHRELLLRNFSSSRYDVPSLIFKMNNRRLKILFSVGTTPYIQQAISI
jgi:hypothetical protein